MEKNPWWNDGDKASGAAATIVILGIALVFFALCIKIVTWIF